MQGATDVAEIKRGWVEKFGYTSMLSMSAWSALTSLGKPQFPFIGIVWLFFAVFFLVCLVRSVRVPVARLENDELTLYPAIVRGPRRLKLSDIAAVHFEERKGFIRIRWVSVSKGAGWYFKVIRARFQMNDGHEIKFVGQGRDLRELRNLLLTRLPQGITAEEGIAL